MNTDIIDFKCKLEFFEGPLDLLLYLIKKNEIDIYNVKLEKITNQYIEYIDMMRLLNIDIAADFFVTAATLLYVKSRALLPQDNLSKDDLDEQEDDPANDLLQKLMEYKQFKEASGFLETLQEKNTDIFPHGYNVAQELQKDEKNISNAGIFDLFSALKDVLKRYKLKAPREVFADKFTVEQKIQQIQKLLNLKENIDFSELLEETGSKDEIICVFLAILELVRMQNILVDQNNKIFGQILIKKNNFKV